MSEAIECPRVGKLIRGCRFEGRYDLGPPVTPEDCMLRARASEMVATILRSAKSKTYVREVCTTCGRTIERVPSTILQSDGA